MRTARVLAIAFVIAGAAASAHASQGASAPPASGTATPAPTPAEGYTYQPEGRRDPFLDLLGAGSEVGSGNRNDGPAGMTVAEISVRGVLGSRGALIAMVEGPDKKTYVVHTGDKFADGVIRSITSSGLTIVQEVNDPLSLVKQREIQKLLRSLESAKE